MVTFLSTELEVGRCTGWSNAQGITDYSALESLSLLSVSTRAGSPLGHALPCVQMGTYFFNFSQSCNLCAFTGTHPVLGGMAHRLSFVKSTFCYLVKRTLRHAMASLYPDFTLKK